MELPNNGWKRSSPKILVNEDLEPCRKVAAAIAIWKEFIPDRVDVGVKTYIKWATRCAAIVIDKEKGNLSIDDLHNAALLSGDLMHTERIKKKRATKYFEQLRTIPGAMGIADFYAAALAEMQLAFDYDNKKNKNQNLTSALDYIWRASAFIRETHAEKLKRILPLAILLRNKYAPAKNATTRALVALLKTMTADCVVAMEQKIAFDETLLKTETDEGKSSLDAHQEELEHDEIKSSSSSLPSLPAISSSPLRVPWPPRDLNAILPVIDDRMSLNHEHVETFSSNSLPHPNHGSPTFKGQSMPSAATISEDELD